MELEDVAEKARRNLMVVSTGILAVWALGIPLDGKLVGAVDLNQVEPWRAWTCAAVVLVYFYLRFHLSPDIVKRRRDYLQQKANDENSRNSMYVFNQFDNQILGKKSELDFQFKGSTNDSVIPGMAAKDQQIQWQPRLPSGLRGALAFAWRYKASPESTNGYFGSASFEIPARWLRRQALLDHYRRIRNLQYDGMEVTLPNALAAVAMGVCIFKIVVSLTHSFPFIRQLLPA